MNQSSEKSLWYLFVEGDVNAFSTLFKMNYSLLHGYGLKLSNNQTLTEDCLQSFFVYLFDHRKNLGGVQHVKSYLFVSFRRTLLKQLKKERKLTSYDELNLNKYLFEFSPEEVLINQEFTKIKTQSLAKLLNQLSSREREAIYLKYYSNLSITEVSEVMNISYQSVQNTLQKAFVKLRTAISSSEIKRTFSLN